MASIEYMMEQAMEGIAEGDNPPDEPFAVPEGVEVVPHQPTMYRIPTNFPNPPPRAPLNGIQGVRLVLAQCGMTDEQMTRFMGTDVLTLEDLSNIRETDVDEHIKVLARTAGNRGGIIIGLSIGARLKALVSLLHELERSGNGVMNAYNVTIPFLRNWQKESQAGFDGDDKITVSPPDKFDASDWVSFKDGMVNYFRQTKGTRKIPLYYVIREDERPETKMSFTETRMWNATLSGPEFDNDNARVFQQLVQVLRNTDAWTYVSGMGTTNDQDGRSAWKRLCNHYDGPHAVEKRVSIAAQRLEELEYKSEASMSMEIYVTRMTNCFRIMAQNGAPKSEREKVDKFLKNIQSKNEYILSFISNLKMNINLRQNYEKCSNALLEAISSTPQLHERSTSNSNRKVAKANAKRGNSDEKNSDSKKKKKKDNKKGASATGPPTGPYTLEEKGGKKFCNGVDITNPKRTFTKEEWVKMGDYVQILKNTRKVSEVKTNNTKETKGNGNRFGTSTD